MKLRKCKTVSVFTAMILSVLMLQGCNTQESINLEIKNNTAELTGELKANSSSVTFSDGNAYNVKINDETLNDIEKIYFNEDLSETLRNDAGQDVSVMLTDFSKEDDRVYADLSIITDEQIKVATPYGYLCYPKESSGKVYISCEEADSVLIYDFSFISESNTDPIKMFSISYKTADENALYTLETKDSQIGLYIESYNLNEENQMVDKEYNEFFVCQENVNYILDNLTFNENITVAGE